MKSRNNTFSERVISDVAGKELKLGHYFWGKINQPLLSGSAVVVNFIIGSFPFIVVGDGKLSMTLQEDKRIWK